MTLSEAEVMLGEGHPLVEEKMLLSMSDRDWGAVELAERTSREDVNPHVAAAQKRILRKARERMKAQVEAQRKAKLQGLKRGV